MENLYEKSALYKQLREIVQNKPALIGQKKKAIAEMEQQVVELENVPKQEAYSLLNPKRYLSKNDAVANQKEIEQLKYKINAESRALEELETLTPIEVVDVQAIQTEMQSLIDAQQPTLDKLATEVLRAQKKYFEAAEAYRELFNSVEDFKVYSMKFVQNQQQLKIQRDYGPKGIKVTRDETVKKGPSGYHGSPYKTELVTAHFNLTSLSEDSRIREGHKEKLFDHHGGVSKYTGW